MSEWISKEEAFKMFPSPESCAKCLAFTKYFAEIMPGREGTAMCEECINKNGIVVLDLPYDPKRK